MKEKTIIYDLNGKGSFQCLAIAFDVAEKENLEKRGYVCLTTPERDKTNCWILFRDKSEVCPNPV